MWPRSSIGAWDEMIAPNPSRANFTSRLMRTSVPEPS
jgi:hypothetical protein